MVVLSICKIDFYVKPYASVMEIVGKSFYR